MKRFLATICFVHLLILSFSQPRVVTSPKNPRAAYMQGEEAFQRAEKLSGRADYSESVQKTQDGLYHAALEKFSEVAEECGRTSSDSLCFHTFIRIALINHYFDSIDAAKRNYLWAIQLKGNLPNIRDSFLFKPYLFLGGILYDQNQFDSASFFYQKAEQIQNGYRVLLDGCQRLYNKEGALYYETGNYRLAKIYFTKALSLLSRSDASYESLTINYKINVASISVKLGQYEEAEKIYSSLLPFKIYENELRHNLGIIDNHLGKFTDAVADLRQVSYSNNPRILDLDYNLATAFDNLRQGDSVRFYLQKAFVDNHTLNGNKKNTSWGLILKFSGEQAAREKKYIDALQYFQRAIIQFDKAFNDGNIHSNHTKFSGIFSYINLFNTLVAKGDIYHQLYLTTKNVSNVESSVEAFRSAFALADYVEKTYESDESRLFLNEIKYSVHSKPIDECLLMYDLTQKKEFLEEAYLFDQRNKASVLSLNLQLSAMERNAGSSGAMMKSAAKLRSGITRLSLRAAQASDTGQLSRINGEITNQEIELGRVQQALNKDPKYAQLQPGDKVPSIALLQNDILDGTTALLSFHLSENSVVIFVVSANAFTYRRLSVGPPFYNDLRSLLKSLHSVSAGQKYEGDVFAKKLYTWLIQPVRRLIDNCTRLIIIPDDELNYLPFESLQDVNNHYLLESFGIQYQYSTALLNLNRNTIHASAGRTLAFAPFALDKDHGQFETLRYSGPEVQALDGKILIGPSATKENFLAEANHYSIVHLATHASADDQQPLNSSIVFYPAGSDSSYRLYAQEVYGLKLDSTRLIILSACETGNGQLVRGEGLMSLSRAFAYAGCPNIITSLWKAEDMTTAFVTTRLHFYLNKSYSYNEALRQAKIDLLHNKEIGPQFKSPNYWAHLVFVGEYQAGNKKHGFLWVVVAALILVLLLLAFLKRKTWLKQPGKVLHRN